jgi:hypothetical protein
MKLLNYILTILILAGTYACQSDPMAEILDGNWNKERNILNINFENQVGTATIVREGNKAQIDFTCNTTNMTSLSAIKINLLEVSFEASSSVSAGDALNFENTDKKATITITPLNGEPLEWTIILHPFNESLLGTWDIKGLYVYGGTGPAYGGASVEKMSDKSWCWSTTDGPAKEQDNYLTFTLDGITTDGNTYGTVVNNAGNDGVYANFVFIAKTPNIDVNNFYRTIPKGTGKWNRNYAAGTVTFTFADGTTKVSSLVNQGATIDLGDGKSRTLTTNAFMFALSGVDDWGSIYTDYDKFVKRPRVYWIDVTKR